MLLASTGMRKQDLRAATFFKNENEVLQAILKWFANRYGGRENRVIFNSQERGGRGGETTKSMSDCCIIGVFLSRRRHVFLLVALHLQMQRRWSEPFTV